MSLNLLSSIVTLRKSCIPCFTEIGGRKNLILHRLFLREEGKTDQQTSVSGDCTPSNMFNNFKAYIFIAFIIHWFKIMATFYCILGYQRNNEVFEVPAIEMLLAFTYGWQRQ